MKIVVRESHRRCAEAEDQYAAQVQSAISNVLGKLAKVSVEKTGDVEDSENQVHSQYKVTIDLGGGHVVTADADLVKEHEGKGEFGLSALPAITLDMHWPSEFPGQKDKLKYVMGSIAFVDLWKQVMLYVSSLYKLSPRFLGTFGGTLVVSRVPSQAIDDMLSYNVPLAKSFFAAGNYDPEAYAKSYSDSLVADIAYEEDGDTLRPEYQDGFDYDAAEEAVREELVEHADDIREWALEALGTASSLVEAEASVFARIEDTLDIEGAIKQSQGL